jgi:hypothetical protein
MAGIDWYFTINGYYNGTPQLWNIYQVWQVVAKSKITPEQYEQITGQVYDINNPPVIPTVE